MINIIIKLIGYNLIHYTILNNIILVIGLCIINQIEVTTKVNKQMKKNN